MLRQPAHDLHTHEPVAADGRTVALSHGNAHDTPQQGRKLLKRMGRPANRPEPVMDRAYEDDEMRLLAAGLGFITTPVVPPRSNRIAPNTTGNCTSGDLFRRLKGFCRVLSRFDMLDAVFSGSSSLRCVVLTRSSFGIQP